MIEPRAHAEPEMLQHFSAYIPVLLLFAGGLIALILVTIRFRKKRPDTAALTARLSDRAWELRETYPFLLLFLLLYISATAGARLIPGDPALTVRLLLAVAVYLVTSLTIARHASRNNRSLQTDFGLAGGQIKYAMKAPVYYLALIPLLMFSSGLLRWLGYELPLQESARIFIDASPHNRILFAATAIIAAPFFEELLLRGLIFPALIKHTGLAGALLTSACLFALLHFNVLAAVILIALLPLLSLPGRPVRTRKHSARVNGAVMLIVMATAGVAHYSGVLHLFISLLILSIGLSAAYWRTGSLWVSIAMHSIFNAVTLAFLLFARV